MKCENVKHFRDDDYCSDDEDDDYSNAKSVWWLAPCPRTRRASVCCTERLRLYFTFVIVKIVKTIEAIAGKQAPILYLYDFLALIVKIIMARFLYCAEPTLGRRFQLSMTLVHCIVTIICIVIVLHTIMIM